MLKDPIQERLKEMEEEDPSKNRHPQGFWKTLEDKVYFTWRSFHSVEKEAGDPLIATIFLKKPFRYENGVPIYSPEEVGNIAQKKYPTSIDERGKWTNSPYSCSSRKGKELAILEPTHVVYLSALPDGNYRFDFKGV